MIHCTATPQYSTVESIQNYWKQKLKWRNPGYHIIVKPDGEDVRLAEDSVSCNGVAGYNSNSIHISYIGGVDYYLKPLDNRTYQQKQTLLRLVKKYKSKYPNAQILGHRDFKGVKKDCPSFNAKKEYGSLQLDFGFEI